MATPLQRPFQNMAIPNGRPRKIIQPKQATADYNVPNRNTVERPEVVTTFDPEISVGCTTLDLTNTRTNYVLSVSGNWLWIPYSTNLTDVIRIQIGSRSQAVRMQSGMSVVGVKFDKLIITHDAIASAEIDISYGFDPRVNFLKFG